MMAIEPASFRRQAQEQGYAVFHYDDAPVHSFPYDAPWLTDAAFCEIYARIRHNTLVDRTRCYSLYRLMTQVQKLPGDALEVGAWRGGTAGLIAHLLTDRTVYVADTFTGVVKSQAWEYYTDGAHADTSEAVVGEFLHNRLGLTNVRLLPGVFPDDTAASVRGRALAFVHVDVDVYQSARDVVDAVWDDVVPGGIVVFDDYGFVSACGGIHRLGEELSRDEDKLFLTNLNGHAYVIKR